MSLKLRASQWSGKISSILLPLNSLWWKIWVNIFFAFLDELDHFGNNGNDGASLTCEVGVLKSVTLDVSAAEDDVTVQTDPVLGPVAALRARLLHTHSLRPVGGEGVKVGTPGQGVDCEPSGRHEGGQAHLSSPTCTPARTCLSVVCHLNVRSGLEWIGIWISSRYGNHNIVVVLYSE